MLKYFFDNQDIAEINCIKKIICEKKLKLSKGNLTDPDFEIEQTKDIFEKIKRRSIEDKNEKLANSQYVAQKYLELLCESAKYFDLIQMGSYKISWNKLQDCLDLVLEIGQFTEYKNRLEVPQIKDMLCEYERLYPYNLFFSTETVISKSHCSICGRPMHSIECKHIKGNLYWGEIAYEIVDKIKTLQAVAIVSNPLDKRCFLEITPDQRTEKEKFSKLSDFLTYNIQPFQSFTINTRIIQKKRDDIEVIGRNDPCSCGSGLKFKKCCGRNLYYQHEKNEILIGKKIFEYVVDE